MEKRQSTFRFPFVSISRWVCFTLVVVLYCASNLFAANDDYSTWKYSGRFYLNSTNTGANTSSDIEDFPVLIRLTEDNFSFGEAKLDGTDIRFAKSDGTHLPYEIERWNYASKLAELWVGVDTVYGNNNSQYIVAYWGKGGAGDSSSANNVFATSENFEAVYHLEEDGNTTASGYKDATGNNNHGTGVSMTTSSDQTCIIGICQDFDGAADYITVADNASLDMGSTFTVSVWLKWESGSQPTVAARILQRKNNWNDADGWEVTLQNAQDNRFTVHGSGGTQGFWDTGLDWADGTWALYTIVFNGTTATPYLNGVAASGLTIDAVTDNNHALWMGQYVPGGSYYWDGKMDEVRLSDELKSADWIKLSYQNQQANDSLVSGDLRHEDYHDWAYSKTFFLNTTDAGANVTGNVTDFPLLVRLHASNFTFSEALTAGADIRFAKSDGTHLKYEIERWDATNSLAEFWVKVDTVYGNNQTQFIKMYWGKAGATSYSNPEAVFEISDGFKAVYHLEEDGNTTAGGYVDASANNNDATGVSMTSSSDVTAIIGLGQDMDGSADYIDANDDFMDNLGAFTLSGWVYRDGTGNRDDLFGQNDALEFFINSDNVDIWTSSTGSASTSYLGFEGGWHHIVVAGNGTDKRTYIDGVLKVTDTDATADYGSSADNVKIGNGINDGGGDFMDGKFDEVRFLSAANSADYIKLSYMNQRAGDLLVVEDMADWTYSRAVLLNTETSGGGITTTLTDFPVLIRLHAGNFTFSEAQGSGQDIRFRESDEDLLSYEIERWDSTNALAEIWVRIPTVTGNSTTEFITMHWGNTNAKDLSYEEHVFEISNDFRGVWHLNEDGNTTTDGYDDASGNDDDATGVSMTASSDVTGIIGIGQDFDGGADYLSSSGINLPTADFSYSAWVKLDVVSDEAVFMAADGAGGNEFGMTIDPDFDWNVDGSSLTGTDIDAVAGSWYHFTVTRSSGSLVNYVNGRSEKTTTDNDSLSFGGCALLIGTDADATCTGTLGNWLNGIIDEPRVSGVARSADWVKLSYMNQKAIPQFADAEDYSDWSNSANIDINTTASGANVSGNVADFPFLLRFTSDNFTFSQALDGGTDLRFAGSSGEHLAFEVERWDSTNALGEVWVKMHSVLGNNNTQYIKMYWGNTNAVARSDGEAVFAKSDGFLGAYHLDEETAGTGTADVYKDATTSFYHGDDYVSNTDQTGIIGKGKGFDGTDDYIALVDGVHDFSGPFSVMAWSKFGSTGSRENIIGKDLSSTQFAFVLYKSTDDAVYMNTKNTTQSNSNGTSVVSMNTWYHVAGVMDGSSNATLYLNGTGNTAAAMGNRNDLGSLRIGETPDSFWGSVNGNIDEVWIFSDARSADFIKLAYENQKSAQVTFNLKDDLTGWTYSRNMFLNTQSSGANVTNNVINFPILIRLKDESFDFTQAQGSGQDLRFTKSNGDDQLDYQIERWDSTNALAEIWVLVDTLYGNNSAQYITMFWGNGTAISRSDGEAVFSTGNDFRGVWHLNEDGNTTADGYDDATAYDVDATGTSLTSSSDVTGNIGIGTELDGAADYLYAAGINLPTADFTYSAWIKVDVTTDEEFFMAAGATSGNSNEFVMFVDPDFDMIVDGAGISGSDHDAVAGTWHLYTATRSSGTITIYADGFAHTTATDNDSLSFAGCGILMGADSDDGCSGSLGNWYDGVLDEARVSGVARSADWVKAAYENQKANQTLVGVEDYTTWNHKTNFYINTTASGAATTANVLDFPYLVRLDSFNFNFSQAQSAGEDIRFSKSDGVQIAYEIERWDATNEVAEIWVKLDTVYTANSSQYFTMYWGKATAADHQSAENVFSLDDNYVGVWHMDEDGNTTTDGYEDVSGYNNHGTGFSMTASSDITAVVGSGQDFDGAADYIRVADDNSLDMGTGDYTIEMWVNVDTFASTGQIFRKSDTPNLEIQSETNSTLKTWNENAGGGSFATDQTLTADTWYHFAVKRTSGTVYHYVNGTQESTTLSASISLDNADYLYLATQEATGEWFDGGLDELRFSNDDRSADFIKLSYHNQRTDDITTNVIDDLTEWSNSTKLYLNTQSTGADVSGNVINFPALVRLTSSDFKFSEAMSNGADIRFSKSDGSALAYEIERWDNVNQLAEIWVKVDTVYGDNTTQYMKMYWGRPNSIDRSNSEAVFSTSNNFTLTYHLNEDPNGDVASSIKDRTSNANHGTPQGTMTTDDLVTGNIGLAVEFDGSDDKITSINNIGITGTTSITASAWFYTNSDQDAGIWDLGDNNVSGGVTAAYIHTSYEVKHWGHNNDFSTGDNATNTTWHLITSTYDGTTTKYFMDGAEIHSATPTHTLTDDVASLGWIEWSTRWANAKMDEFRVSNTNRSADWIKLSYENQKTSQSLICFEENYVQDWTYKQDLTLNTSPGGANVTNDVLDFPILVRLESGNFDFSQAQGSGQDLRFTKSNGTPLFYEIERWDSTNAAAEIWVRVDTVFGTNSSQYLQMYWGNSTASSKSNANAVFDVNLNFASVWHLEEDGNTTASGYKDATDNAYHGTGTSTTSSSDVDAMIGRGQDLDGSADYITIGDKTNLDLNGTQAFTLSAWVRPDAATHSGQIISKFNTSVSGVWNIKLNSGKLRVHREVSPWNFDGSTVTTSGTFYYITGIYDGTSLSGYVNGVSDGTAITIGSIGNTSDEVYIGAKESSSSVAEFFNGVLDEVRVSKTNRSTDWIKLSYENQKAAQTLVNFSSPATSYSKATRFLFNTTSSGAEVPGDVSDIPILVRIDSSHIDFSITKSDGSDILFTDSSGAMLYHEVVLWDKGNDTALVWVKVPTVDGNSDDDYIDIHYGCGNCSNDFHKADSVWNGYDAVYHLIGGETQATDITSNAYNLTYSQAMPFSSGVTAPYAPTFDGSSADAQYTSGVAMTATNNFSFSTWFNWGGSTSDVQIIFHNGNTGSSGCGFLLDDADSHNMDVLCGGVGETDTETAPTAGTWYHLVGVRDAGTMKIYIDGSSQSVTGNPTPATPSGKILIGSNGTGEYYKGSMQETRIASSAHSADYVKLSYENQKLGSTFLSSATINGPVPVPGLIFWARADSGVNKNSSDQVTKWDDISGAGNHATQSNLALAPIFKDNILGGKPVLRFDGSDDQYDDVFANNTKPNKTVFAVFSHDHNGTGTPRGSVWSLKNAGSSSFYPMYQDGKYIFGYGGGNLTTTSVFTRNQFYIVTGYYGTNLAQLFSNNELVTSTASQSTETEKFDIAHSPVNVSWFKGDIAEIMYYERALNDVERGQVYNYLAERYFITPKILTTLTASTNSSGDVDLNWTLPVSSSPMADTVGIWAKLNTYPDSSRNGILVGYFPTTDTSYTWSVDYPGVWHFTLLVRDTNDNWSDVNSNAQDTAAVFGNAGIKLTFNTTSTGASVNEDQVNFPMLVRLVAADSGIFNACPNADGTHMRFIDDDGVTFLDYDVERYDNSSDLAEFWVRVPVVDGNSSTDFVTMEYRGCNNPDASNHENVFRTADDFGSVWQLNEDGNTTSGGYNDATSNSYDGTGVSMTTSSDVTGTVGLAQDFDGTSDYLTISEVAFNSMTSGTISGWIYLDARNEEPITAKQHNGTNTYGVLSIGHYSNTGGTNSGGTAGVIYWHPRNSTTTIPASSTALSLSTWYHLAVSFSSSAAKIYINGALDATTTGDYSVSSATGTTASAIGAWLGDGTGRFDGKIDQLEFATTDRTTDWIKLAYETQKTGSTILTQSLIQRIYVDSALGSDNYTCIQSENPSTPKKTITSAVACAKHDAADTVRVLVQPGTYTDSTLKKGGHDVLIQAADLNNSPILNGNCCSPSRTLKIEKKIHLRNLIIKASVNNDDGIVNANNDDNISIIGCQFVNDGDIKHDIGIHINGGGASNILVANNIIDGATTTGIEIDANNDANIVHNVIYGTTTTGIDAKSSAADDISITNNIIYNVTTGIAEADADNDIGLISNNLFYNVTTQVSGGDVDDSPVTSDPLFVSTTFGDKNYMKVSANSPAIDAGTNSQDPNTSFTNTATIDLWGTVRPVGSARDIGVYEGTGVSQTFTGEFDTLTTVESGSDTVGVHTSKWAIIFRKTEGGGIADLRDKDAWVTNLLGSDPLFEINLNGTTASSVTTNAPTIMSSNRVQAKVRQEQPITANFNLVVDYTIYPSGHIYIQSKLVNTSGSAQNNQTLDYLFEISSEDAGFQNAGNENGYGYLTTSTRDVYVGVTDALNLPAGLTWDANFTAANNNIVWDTDDIDFGIADEFEHHFLIYIGDESLGTDKAATIYNDTYYPQKLDAVTGTPFASESWEYSMVGQWPMDEGAGSTARDVSGNARNGTITTATYTTGKSQTALDFTTSAYVTVSHHADFNVGPDRSFMAWVKKASTFSGSESDARFISKSGDLILGRSTSANQVIFTAGGTTLTDPDATPNDAWFHIAGTIDVGKITRLYVNGVLKDVASAGINLATNSSDLLLGKNGSNTGFDGEIDDVRIYHQALSTDAIQAIYNEGLSHKSGAYRGRASNNNRFVGIMNQSSDVGRFQPVFMIDNWYGGDVPQYVYVDGFQMTHYTDFVSIEEPFGGGGNTLVLQFNKTFTGTDIDVFIDDNDSSGFLGASSIMPTLHTAVTASDQITVKNLSGATFGDVGSKEWEFIIDLDGSTGTTDGDGGIYSWKSSEVSPNLAISSATDLTGSDSVTLDQMKFDNVALSGASWTSPDPNTYTIDDSSSTRLKITMGATTINVGTPDVVDARTYTFYPTGKIFVSHSITSISAQPTTPQIWIERLNSITASTDATSSTTPQDSARGGKLADANISGSFHGFGVSVLSVKSNGTTVSGQTAVTGNSNASSVFALNFNNTYFETADATITVNYMIDFTQNYTTAASLDSALQDVQQITSLTAVTGTIVTNDAMDFNTDGFAEGEGVWTYSASSGVAEFKLNATQARFHPAFKISSWNSSSLPQIVMVNNAEQVKGYHYNATVDGTNNSLIIQFNKVFTGATNHILISQNASLAVTLSSFSAIGGEGVDTLKWTTESELDNLGFYVLRRVKSKFPAGSKKAADSLAAKMDSVILSAQDLVKLDTSWKRLNKRLVPGPKGGRSSSTRNYLFIDRAVKYEVTYEYILVSVDVNSLEDFFGPVEAMPTYPMQTRLYGNYPNPFNPMTNIRFDLRAPTKMSLKIYDIRGHLIRTLISPNKPLPAGQYRYTWDAKDDFGIEVPSGHYIYMFVTPRYKKARKMTLLK